MKYHSTSISAASKTAFSCALAGALLLAAQLPVAAQSMVKIGTVDMKLVFEKYYKTKDAEARINEARGSAKKEMDDRADVYQRGRAEVVKIEEEIQKPELSKETKEQKLKVYQEKVAELKQQEREMMEFRQGREKQLSELSQRMRGGIVDDINKIVEEIVKESNYDIVVDRSGPSLNGVPVVLYAKDAYDFTRDVTERLNKNKGKDPVSASPEPAKAEPAKTEPVKKKK